jgi:valyl-tRNA synthetase
MNLTSAALILVRKSKSDLKLSMKAEIELLKMTGPAQLNSVARDLQAVGNIAQLELSDASEIAITEIRFAKSE